MAVTYDWRGSFERREVEALHAEAFHHDVVEDLDWQRRARDHSLGWVCARDGGELVGFVTVAWDGAAHAFMLDTMVVDRAGRQDIGAESVSVAIRHARAAARESLHVDSEGHPTSFYFDACGSALTHAGLVT
jgi:hypothetical protein